MSKTITKIMAGLGLVAGLGVAILPLSSYAVDEDVTVTVTIGGAVGSDPVDCTTASGGNISAGSSTEDATCDLDIDSNVPITISIKDTDEETNLTGAAKLSLHIADLAGTNQIPAISGSLADITAGTAPAGGWGWKYVAGDAQTTASNATYNGITNAFVTAATSSGAVSSAEAQFQFKIYAPVSQAPGTYTNKVTIRVVPT